MKEEDFPEIKSGREWYILRPSKSPAVAASFLLRTGEIVTGVRCSDSATAVRWMEVYGDTYLGIGVFHG